MEKIKCKYCGTELNNTTSTYWFIRNGENSVCSNCEEKATIDADMIGTIGD